MVLPIYQVDAFSKGIFSGNPAAVVILTEWLGDALLQNIASENNLSETAFIVAQHDLGYNYDLRWFTPKSEVDLCGHATLATAHVLSILDPLHKGLYSFNTRSGVLTTNKISYNKYLLDFPSDHGVVVTDFNNFEDIIGCQIDAMFKGKDDYLAIVSSEEKLKSIKPDFRALSKISSRGLIVSSIGNDADFVSRGFFPAFGIDEDPATGSAHTLLTPYWTFRLKKNRLVAFQISERMGYFDCTYRNERVSIVGQADLFMKGEIYL